MRRVVDPSKETNLLSDPSLPYLVTCGGDTVKIFDLTAQSSGLDPCALSYTPTPGSQVNSVKWNHTSQVVASSGDDKKISLWRRNGKSLGTLQFGRNDCGDLVDESISAINFCNKGSRYLCSGGSGRIVRIWDLQKKLCIKKLSGHTDTISGVMYNCKDEHLASISLKGDLILHNLASGSQAASLKDPNGQALRVLDYSRYSRQVLVAAGDDGSVHLWDTAGRSPKVSWPKQHSAPTSGVCFSPSSDKMVASVGLDKKLYIFDSTSKRPAYFVSYETPFSSLVFRDDGYILAAGTNTGRVVFYDVRGKPQSLTVLLAYSSNEAITGLCWQRLKSEAVGENSTDEIALLGSTVEDSILMPDPIPSMSALNFPASSSAGPRSSLSATNAASTSKYASPLEGTPTKVKSSGSLTKLHAQRSGCNRKDDMDVFSPLVDVQPITPYYSLWDDKDASSDDLQLDKKPSLFPSTRRFPHAETSWRFPSTSFQEDTTSTRSQSELKPITSSMNESSFSFQPSEFRSSNAFAEKSANLREGVPSLSRTLSTDSTSSSSKFAGLQDIPNSTSHTLRNSLSSSSSSLTSLQTRHSLYRDLTSSYPESLPSSKESLSAGQGSETVNLDVPFSLSMLPPRFSAYAERLSASTSLSDGTPAMSSPKAKKIGTETRAEFPGLLSRKDSSDAMGRGSLPGTLSEYQRESTQSTDLQQGLSPFSLQLIQRTLEETLGSVQKSIHEDVRNLHIELIRQFHMHEMETSTLLNSILEKQDELLKEVHFLRRENQQLRQLL